MSMGMSFFTSCPLTGASACRFKPCARATRHCLWGALSVCTGLKRPIDSSLWGHG